MSARLATMVSFYAVCSYCAWFCDTTSNPVEAQRAVDRHNDTCKYTHDS